MEKLVVCIAQVWFWPILPHKQSSNLEGSVGLFYELWSSVLSIDFQLDSSQVIGWAILAALFSFSETNWEFPWLFTFLLKCPPSFHLHHPGRWQQIFIKNVSCTFFHSSFLQLCEVCQYRMLKSSPTPWCSHLQTSLLGWCTVPFVLQTWCALWHPKSSNLLSSDQTIFSQYFTGLSKCRAANFKRALTCFFFSNGVLCGERAYRPWRLSALLIVFF